MMPRPARTHPPLSPDNDNPRLYTVACFFFIGLLGALIFIPDYLPMVDLPQHAAQVAMWKQFDAGTLPGMENYTLKLFTPYLGGFSVARTLSGIMPLITAIKSTVFLALLLPLLVLYLELRKRLFLRWSVFLVIPFLFNWTFYWGFLNFIFAIGPMLFCSFLSIRLINRRSGYSYYVIGACALLLFFFHIFCALMYVGLIGLYVLAQTKSLKKIVLSFIAFLPFLALTAGWQISRSPPGQGIPITESFVGTVWFLGINRITNLPTTMLSGAYYGEMVALSVLLATGILVIGALYYGGIRKERLLLLLVTALAYMLLPQYVMNCAYVYQRFAFLVVPLAIYAIGENLAEKRIFCRTLQICSILIPTIYLSSLIGVFTAFSAEVNTFTHFTRHMEKNKRVLSMMLDNRAESVKGPVMLHFPSWYQATHGGYVAFNFNSLVKYHPGISTPRVGNKFLWNPRTFDQRTFEEYDYYILKGPFRFSSFPFDDSGENFELLYREGDWHLFSLREKATSQPGDPYHSASAVE